MEPEFWFERWKLNEIGFHQARYNRLLVEHWPEVSAEAGPGPVFVPLCGKTLDMLWLLEQGHPVLGIELSSIAVTDFFQEQGLAFEIDESDRMLSYHMPGIRLYCGDFFSLCAEHLKAVRAVYDRAALIALPREMQQRYVKHLLEIVPDCAPILLITLEYDPSRMSGPPFSTPEERVRELFEATHTVRKLATHDVLPEHPGLAAKGLPGLQENAYGIFPKA